MTTDTKQFSLSYLLLTVTFVVCLIVANLTEIKTVDLGYFTITAGVIVFPISYIISDCVVEVYGLARARLMIWIGFFMSLAVALMLQVAIMLPGGADWSADSQMSMVNVYGAVPRIMAASFTAFLVGSMINAWVMSKMKQKRHEGTAALGYRAIISTLLGEGADSLIFFPIAFGGVLPVSTIISLIVTQALLKTLYEVLILPVTLRVIAFFKKIEIAAVS